MHLNTELHRLLGLPFPLHKTQIDPAVIPAEACDFGHEPLKNHHASLSITN